MLGIKPGAAGPQRVATFPFPPIPLLLICRSAVFYYFEPDYSGALSFMLVAEIAFKKFVSFEKNGPCAIEPFSKSLMVLQVFRKLMWEPQHSGLL